MSEQTIDHTRPDESAADNTSAPAESTGRRTALRRIALGGVGAATGVVALSSRAAAGDSEAAATGGTALELGVDSVNTSASPTTVVYGGTDQLTETSALTVGTEAPNATDGNNVLPAAIGGYGKGVIANGLHGSTVSPLGAGVVAAHLAPAQDADADPADAAAAGLIAASVGGPQIRFAVLPGAVAGPTTGTHTPGELYVDVDGTLWFTVPVAESDTEVRFVKLAGTPTAGALQALPFPARVFDTREGDGAVKPAASSVNEVDLTTKLDESESGLTVGATAALLNITIADSDNKGFFSVSATGVETPDAEVFSNGNWTQTGTNLGTSVTTAISADGKIDIELGPEGGTHLIVDVVGFYL